MDDDPTESLASLTPYPEPEYTEAPTPIPSSKIPVESSTEPATTEPATTEPAKSDGDVEYDGPAKTGKTLKDLALDLGAPESLSSLIDEMQDALIGIIGDLVNNTGERTSVADILGHENRLRGLGALCVLAALVGLLFDSVMHVPGSQGT
jgi:hypothetical protein